MMGNMVQVKCVMRITASFETQCMKELHPGESWWELAALNRKVMHQPEGLLSVRPEDVMILHHIMQKLR